MFRYIYSGGAKLNTRATATWKAGQVLVLGKLVAICPRDIPSGEAVGLQLDGVFEGDAVAAETWTIGEALYVVPGTADGTLTKTVGTNAFFGYAATAKAANETKAVAILVQRSPA